MFEICGRNSATAQGKDGRVTDETQRAAFEKWWQENPKNALVINRSASWINEECYQSDLEVWTAATAHALKERIELALPSEAEVVEKVVEIMDGNLYGSHGRKLYQWLRTRMTAQTTAPALEKGDGG